MTDRTRHIVRQSALGGLLGFNIATAGTWVFVLVHAIPYAVRYALLAAVIMPVMVALAVAWDVWREPVEEKS